jgi:hypothetical protein
MVTYNSKVNHDNNLNMEGVHNNHMHMLDKVHSPAS